MFGLLIAFLACLVTTNALCVPGTVPNISLSNSRLAWNATLNPNKCTIVTYIINVLDDGVIYQYQTGNTVLSYDVSFLESCKVYDFEVHALTNESVLGPSELLTAETSLPDGYGLDISTIATLIVNENINLSWNLENPNIYRCISYYRVVYWDDDNDPQDYYAADQNFSVKGEIPCRNYTFQVNAIIVNPDIQGPIAEITNVTFTEAPQVPHMVSLETSQTSVEMVWQIESYVENRCQMQFLNVSTVGLPANTSSIQIPITDNVNRPNVTFNITGLEPNNVYVSEVSVVNVGGASKNVTVSYQTTDNFVFDRLRNIW